MNPADLKLYWLTRDTDATGALSDEVDVWAERPRREDLPGGGAMWIGQGESGLSHRCTTWPVATALKNCYVVPGTDRECIRVGKESA